jgi:hypothetical protein
MDDRKSKEDPTYPDRTKVTGIHLYTDKKDIKTN